MLLAELNRDEPALPNALVVIPLGATEQHGPHLPLGTDTFIVDRVARSAAEGITRFQVVVAPALPIGYSVHHLPFGPTCTLSADTYAAALLDIGGSILRTGARRVFFVNGHGGNAEIMLAVTKRIATESGVLIGAGSYWKMAGRELAACGAELPDRIPGHAGEFETSVMLALHPELVAPTLPGDAGDRPLEDPEGFSIESPTRRIGALGRTDRPASATRGAGARYLDAAIAGVRRSLERFWDECEAEVT